MSIVIFGWCPKIYKENGLIIIQKYLLSVIIEYLALFRSYDFKDDSIACCLKKKEKKKIFEGKNGTFLVAKQFSQGLVTSYTYSISTPHLMTHSGKQTNYISIEYMRIC